MRVSSNAEGADRAEMRSVSLRTLLGISIFWFPLSFLSDGMASLVLPHDLETLAKGSKATLLGLLSFGALVLAMLIQPFAGRLSDRTRDRWGRGGVLGLGLAITLPCLALYSLGSLAAVAAGFVLTLAGASVAQAGLQGYVPDMVPRNRRGLASGLKAFMDLAGATAGFLVIGQVLGSGGPSRATLVVAAVLAAGLLLSVTLVREPKTGIPPGTGENPGNPFRIDLVQHRALAWLVFARFLFLLGTYAVGRFFLFFVGERLGLDPGRAAEQAGALLGALTLLTMLSAPAAGWAADRWGRMRLMYAGASMSAAGILALIGAHSSWQILAFGSLLSAGNACFAAANWAMTADLVPRIEAARFFALANFGTMGAAACAGLFGPAIDGANRLDPGSGYRSLFLGAGLASLASILALRRSKAAMPPDLLLSNSHGKGKNDSKVEMGLSRAPRGKAKGE